MMRSSPRGPFSHATLPVEIRVIAVEEIDEILTSNVQSYQATRAENEADVEAGKNEAFILFITHLDADRFHFKRRNCGHKESRYDVSNGVVRAW